MHFCKISCTCCFYPHTSLLIGQWSARKKICHDTAYYESHYANTDHTTQISHFSGFLLLSRTMESRFLKNLKPLSNGFLLEPNIFSLDLLHSSAILSAISGTDWISRANIWWSSKNWTKRDFMIVPLYLRLHALKIQLKGITICSKMNTRTAQQGTKTWGTRLKPRGGGGHFLVTGNWVGTARRGRIFTTRLTITGSPF